MKMTRELSQITSTEFDRSYVTDSLNEFGKLQSKFFLHVAK